MSHASGRSVLMEKLNSILKYLFEFQIRTKSQSHIKSYISIEKHVQGEIIEIKIQTQKSI